MGGKRRTGGTSIFSKKSRQEVFLLLASHTGFCKKELPRRRHSRGRSSEDGGANDDARLKEGSEARRGDGDRRQVQMLFGSLFFGDELGNRSHGGAGRSGVCSEWRSEWIRRGGLVVLATQTSLEKLQRLQCEEISGVRSRGWRGGTIDRYCKQG